MQDSLLRLLGLGGVCAGLYLLTAGHEIFGFIGLILGLAATLKTTRLAYRRFGGWRPRNTDTGEDSAQLQEQRRRGQQRLKAAAARGPGGRRGDIENGPG